MKKIFVFLIFSTVAISGCKFIKTKILGKPDPADTLEAYMDKMESQRLADSIALAELEQQRLDSLAALEEEENTPMVSTNKYHVISGSFKTPSYAQKYKQKMIDEFGYKNTQILTANNGFNLVSIESFPNFNSALRELRHIREEGNFEVWLYVAN